MAFGLASCSTDKAVAEAEPASEHGRWGVAEATRDGAVTHMLDAAYFEFDTSRSVMTTNLVGEELAVNYVIDNQELLTPENQWFQRLEIRELSDSSLVLAGKVDRGFFTFALRPEEEGERPVLARPESSDAVPADDDPSDNRQMR